MKKPDRRLIRWRNRRNKRRAKIELRKSRSKRIEAKLRRAHKAKYPEHYHDREVRRAETAKVYKRRPFDADRKQVPVAGTFGIEDLEAFDYFVETASEFIDFNSKELRLDLKECTRVWPSSVTLLASLKQWVELTAHRNALPRISSSRPNSDEVRGYLTHCGFYNYVNRESDPSHTSFDPSGTVPIRREVHAGHLELRESEIGKLLRDHADLTPEQLERFECIILPEIFCNITEHGRVHVDNGWWVLAQHHPAHGFISICLADNGIGIGNSLRTGAQRDYIKARLGKKFQDDGECIRIALEENISGSLRAIPPLRRVLRRAQYKSGARKGNGLKRMCEACLSIGVRFSILSHKGFLVLDQTGKIVRSGSKDSRVFAGTLYHLIVRAKTKEATIGYSN